jgi:hypothetical protein
MRKELPSVTGNPHVLGVAGLRHPPPTLFGGWGEPDKRMAPPVLGPEESCWEGAQSGGADCERCPGRHPQHH